MEESAGRSERVVHIAGFEDKLLSSFDNLFSQGGKSTSIQQRTQSSFDIQNFFVIHFQFLSHRKSSESDAS